MTTADLKSEFLVEGLGNVSLRKPIPEQAELAFGIISNETNMRFFMVSNWTLDEYRKFIPKVMKDRKRYPFWIYAGETFVGICQIWKISNKPKKYGRNAYIFCALSPEYQKMGTARAALKLMIEFAFNELNPPIDTIRVHIIEENRPSLNLAFGLGFKKTIRHKSAGLVDGQKVPAIYAILRRT